MNDPEIQQLIRAAAQRFTAAEILFRNQAYFDSMYLAGYVVECALKALILGRMPQRKRGEFAKTRFQGSRAHDFEYLAGLLAKQGIQLPPEISRHLRRVRSWSPDFRYKTGRGNRKDADQYLKSAVEFLYWVRKKL